MFIRNFKHNNLWGFLNFIVALIKYYKTFSKDTTALHKAKDFLPEIFLRHNFLINLNF